MIRLYQGDKMLKWFALTLTILAASHIAAYDVGCKDSQNDNAYGKCVTPGCCKFTLQDSSTDLCTDGGNSETCCYHDYTCGRLGCLSVVGTWISRYAYHTSESDVDLGFSVLKSLGITRVYFNVWADGNLYAYSDTAFNEGVTFGGDRLQWAINAGNKYGIEVFAWFEYGAIAAHATLNDFASNAAAKGWLLCTNPSSGCNSYFVDQSAWLNMMNSQVVQFLGSMAADVVRNYQGLKGIQFDDHIGLPTKFSMVTSVPQSQRFQITRDAIQSITNYAKGANPNIHVSLSPSPLDWAMDTVSVDWTWFAEDGVVMEIVPQYYRWDFGGFQYTVDTDLPRVPRHQNTVMAGIMLWEDKPVPGSEVDKMVSYVYDKNLRGISFWFADALVNGTYTPVAPTMC